MSEQFIPSIFCRIKMLLLFYFMRTLEIELSVGLILTTPSHIITPNPNRTRNTVPTLVYVPCCFTVLPPTPQLITHTCAALQKCNTSLLPLYAATSCFLPQCVPVFSLLEIRCRTLWKYIKYYYYILFNDHYFSS